ncbi:MAG: hypothetical protein U9R53_01900 [Chloroflexota bacterium]|nr:hypothetical protein [Chloroflexota bacterium]
MDFVELNISESYWDTLEIDIADIEFLYAYLLEKGTPLTSEKLTSALIHERIHSEKDKLQERLKENGEIYLPKDEFSLGDKIQFPALKWVRGEVIKVRNGNNPILPDLKVITVALETGQTQQFASNLLEHQLNQFTQSQIDSGEQDEGALIEKRGDAINAKLEDKLNENTDIIRIGDLWFPKSLLIEFNIGHLNLAEAILDMHSGGPLLVDTLIDQIDIKTDDPKELVEFSLNYALQEDARFDEVGPSGVIQWFLNRLEPEFVREKPLELIYQPFEYDRSLLSKDMIKSEQQIADELVELDPQFRQKTSGNETLVVLNYPHWRTGSIPLTAKTRVFFPTALESPRVKFKFIDAKGQEISAWVVRPYNYVYGLRDWYEELELMPGSILKIRHGKKPGEVLIEPQKKRSNREWIRTLLIGADGGIVFAMLKQTITADFNERIAVAVPSTEILDELWRKRIKNPKPINLEMMNIMRELAKLNPQGHVHGVELYSALNCIRRCPPGVVFSILSSDPEFISVGDLYFRISSSS